MSEFVVRDRDGELRTVHNPDAEICRCDGEGNLVLEDAYGRPIVCLLHRPHLRGRIGARPRGRSRWSHLTVVR